MTSGVHLAPPSVVEITAAPLGAPPTPTVEPTAQHREALAQSTAARELTGTGSGTDAKVPSHGESGAKVDRVGSDPTELVQAAADRSTKIVAATAPARQGLDRPRTTTVGRAPSVGGV
jgi:hypothetical protein